MNFSSYKQNKLYNFNINFVETIKTTKNSSEKLCNWTKTNTHHTFVLKAPQTLESTDKQHHQNPIFV